MISGLVLKYLNGECFVIRRGYETARSVSSSFCLTVPNPVLLQWLGANTRAFRDAYALSEMIQWIWRTQIRNGEPVCVYMPSKKMRVIVGRWLGVD